MSEVIMVGGCSIAQGGGCRSCGGRGCGACCKKVAYMGKDGKPFIPRYGSTVLMPDPEGCVAGVITPEQDLCAPFSSGYSACQQKRIIKQLEDGVLVLTPDDGVVVSVAAGQGFPDEAIQWQFETPWWACYSFSNFILDLNEQDAGRYTVAVNSTEVADDGRGTWVDAVNPGPITRLQVVEETQFRNTQTMMQIGQTAKSSQGRKGVFSITLLGDPEAVSELSIELYASPPVLPQGVTPFCEVDELCDRSVLVINDPKKLIQLETRTATPTFTPQA